MTMLPDPLEETARRVLARLQDCNLRLTAAESCTGGLVAAALTGISGCSSVVERAFVTYSNDAKSEMLGVPADLIEAKGAVSEEVARAMAAGALAYSHAHVAVAITGIAGPSGGTAEKPVGLVHFAACRRGAEVIHRREVFPGDRDAVRLAAAIAALEMVENLT